MTAFIDEGVCIINEQFALANAMMEAMVASKLMALTVCPAADG